MTTSPDECRILFVGEAYGQEEQTWNAPFVGPTGRELFSWLLQVWGKEAPQEAEAIRRNLHMGQLWVNERGPFLSRLGFKLTNVFNFRPDGNNVLALCGSRAEVGTPYPPPELGLPRLPAIRYPGHYIKVEYLPELLRLREEILRLRPNVVVALGNTALWALCGETKIGALRGTIRNSTLVPGVKVLPTYHPAGVLRTIPWRPVALADIYKSAKEATFSDIRRPPRKILTSPTLPQAEAWAKAVLAHPPRVLACDTETKIGQISMISFADAPDSGLVIPFIDWSRPGGNFWETVEEELHGWRIAEWLLASSIPKLFQNGLYDLQYLMPMGLRISHINHDTMLRHHSLIPESQKSLGFMGSLYTSEPAWKLMRLKKADTEKRDE